VRETRSKKAAPVK